MEEFHRTQLWAPGAHPVLVGRRILVPRPDGPLAEALRATGAEVDAVPLTEQAPLPFDLPGAPDPVDWLVLTSATGVTALVAAGHALNDLARRTAAVGQATAAAIEAAGGRVDLVADGDAAALVGALPEGPGTVLTPGSQLAAPTLADGLSARGWRVHRVATYTTRPLPAAPAELVEAWPTYDAVVLTAGSVARAVADLLGEPSGHTRVVTLGAPSAAAARAAGLPVHATAASPDADGVLAALVDALQEPA
nr:uroporphyrinogen-III synthase [Propioniciclava soli]